MRVSAASLLKHVHKGGLVPLGTSKASSCGDRQAPGSRSQVVVSQLSVGGGGLLTLQQLVRFLPLLREGHVRGLNI
jgi:hypothetical protein